MDVSEINANLGDSPLTQDLTGAQRERLAGIAQVRALENDEVLLHEGDIDNAFHLISAGMLAVTRDAGGGDWTTLHILRKGDLAGELGFIDGRPHSATLRAVGETTVFTFERERIESLVEQDPWLIYRLMQNIVRTVHHIVRRMNEQYVEMSNYISKQHGRY